jgi:peptidoglycan hydrolase-like amidase
VRRSFVLVLFCFLVLLGSNLSAAVLDLRILELGSRQPVANAKISIFLRTTGTDEFGRTTLAPLEAKFVLMEGKSDANGKFRAEAPEGFVAIEIRGEGYAEYLNSLVKVEAGTTFFTSELVHAQATKAETAILEARREGAQIAERMRVADEPIEARAADITIQSQPVVPTDVYVSNLNGYSGMMNLDEYISGVCSLEMGDGFPYEALKAQAVAARTYALARLRDRGYANGGQAYTSTLGTRCKAAAYNSSGVALTYILYHGVFLGAV